MTASNISTGDAVAQTPSQTIVAAGTRTATETDARGRKIAVRKLNPLDRMRLFEIVGADNSRNASYLSYAIILASVTAIDGIAQAFPASKLKLEAIASLLDDDGMDAASKAYAAFDPSESGAPDDVKN